MGKKPKKPQHKNMLELLKTRMDTARQRGEGREAYIHALQIEEEEAFRKSEAACDDLQREIFRLCFLQSYFINEKATPRPSVYSLFTEGEDVTVDIFASSVASLLRECTDQINNRNEQEPLDQGALLIALRKSIPEAFCEDEALIGEKLLRPAHADPLTAFFYTGIDWLKVCKGNNPVVWAKNALKLMDAFLDGDTFSHLEERRKCLLAEMAGCLQRFIADHLVGVADFVRNQGIPCPYGLTAPENLPAEDFLEETLPSLPRHMPKLKELAPTLTSDLSQFLPDGLPANNREYRRFMQKRLGNEAEPERTQRLNILLSSTFLLKLTESEYVAAFAKSFATDYTGEELTYAVLKMLTVCGNFEKAPPYLNLLMDVWQQRAFPGCENTENPLETSQTVYTFQTYKPLDVQNSWFPPVDEDDYGPEDYVQTLGSLLFTETQVVQPTTLSIPMKLHPLLEKLGFSGEEAAALCGYMQGCRQLVSNLAAFGGKFEAALQFEKIVKAHILEEMEDKRKELEQRPAQRTEGEAEEKWKEAHLAQERAEASQRKLEKEKRLLEYETEKAREGQQRAEEENQSLRQQVQRMQQEMEELQQTVLTLSQQAGEGQETENTVSFPCDVGREKKIRVFGGPDNWIAEQSRRFPYLSFCDANTMPNEQSILNADMVLVNTFVMNHKFFWIIQNACKKYNIPLHYFSNRGINRCSQQIIEFYEELCGE